MIKMGTLNRKGLKKKLAERGFRIGKNVLEFFIQLKEKEIGKEIEKIVRNARLSGRKTIKKEDVEEKGYLG